MSVTHDRLVVFSGIPVSSTNKTDRHDIAEILLKLALITIAPPSPLSTNSILVWFIYLFNRFKLMNGNYFCCRYFNPEVWYLSFWPASFYHCGFFIYYWFLYCYFIVMLISEYVWMVWEKNCMLKANVAITLVSHWNNSHTN